MSTLQYFKKFNHFFNVCMNRLCNRCHIGTLPRVFDTTKDFVETSQSSNKAVGIKL